MRGDNVKIPSNTTNENPEVSYVDLVMNLTIQGPNITVTYDKAISYIQSLESLNVTFTWDTTGETSGDYIVTLRMMGSTRVLSEASTSFTIELLKTDLPNVELVSADPTVTRINVTSLNLSEINETYKPESTTPQSAYMVNSTGAGIFTLRFTNITNAKTIIAYKINATNQWIELDTTTTIDNVTFTMSVGDPPVVFASGAFTTSIDLYTGWNLISAPLNFTTWGLGNESVVGDPLNVTPKNSLTSIYRYNSSTEQFEKCDHLGDWGWAPATGSENFTNLEPCRGYWVWAKNDCNLTFTGTVPSDINVTLDANWNLIGWYSLEKALLGQESVVGDPLNVTTKNSLSSIYRYNSSTGLFEKCDRLEDWGWWPATGAENFTELEPGRGYWVRAKNACLWQHAV